MYFYSYEKWVAEEKERLRIEREKRKERNLQGRLNPRTDKDFELVWSALESWRAEQIQIINETTKTTVEQKATVLHLFLTIFVNDPQILKNHWSLFF